MRTIDRLLLQNKAWSQECADHDPEFFRALCAERTPRILWIGCSDSRIPEERITASEPGLIFMHRNIANLVIRNDISLLSALQYAVDVLEVEDVVVCGHYGCGSVRSALDPPRSGAPLATKWLAHIEHLCRAHREDLDRLHDPEERLNRLVELNVAEQVRNLAHTAIIQRAWQSAQRPMLHGWLYGPGDGILRELCALDWNSAIDPLFHYELE